MIRAQIVFPVILCGLLAVSGCIRLGSRAEYIRYYVLGGEWTRDGRGSDAAQSGLSVGMSQLKLASYLEQPYIIIREGTHEISYSEFHRWGEDLDRAINRTVAGYLAARLPIMRVDIAPWPSWAEYDYIVQVSVLRFEGTVTGTTQLLEPGGSAHLLATWEIVNPETRETLDRGITEIFEDEWAVGNYADLVARLDVSLERLAQDLLTALIALENPRSTETR